MQQIRVAPTPHPDEIKALKKINPRYADIVMDMAPREQKFRHFSTLFGQFNFVLIAALGYGLGGWLGYLKLEVASIAAIVVTSYLVYALKTNKPMAPKIDAKNGTVATDSKE